MGPQDIILTGDQKAKDAYVQMLYNSTGNNYSIVDNKLTLVGSDKDFKGAKSETLISTIQKGIDSKEVYSLSLVGANGDDKVVFIDSYSEKKIDVSDLGKLGEASTFLQGAAIGHYMNEIQESGGFDAAHKSSLGLEGKIYGELVGDRSITTRVDYGAGAAVDGYQNITYKYNAGNSFVMQQGATSTTTTTNELNGVKVPFPVKTIITKGTGELKSVKKLP